MIRHLIFALALGSFPSMLSSATLTITVNDPSGAPIDEAVVWALPSDGPVESPTTDAVMDQLNRMFVPHVLAVQTGTEVRFPNSDNVRHHVYSFSPAKRFQLPLYEGHPAEPVLFDKPGVVALGCNIHDQMSAFILVVDTPWFGITQNGTTRWENLPEGHYTVHAWHESARRAESSGSVESVEWVGTDDRQLVITLGKE